MQIHDVDAGQRGDLRKVGVECEQGETTIEAQADELGVNLGNARDIVVEHLDVDARLALQRLKVLQTASALRSAYVVGRVGEALQLGEYRARHQQRAVQEAGTHDIEHQIGR